MLVDVSAGGMRLLLAEPLPEGTVLAFDLSRLGGAAAQGRLAYVRHCQPVPAPPESGRLLKAERLSGFLRRLFGRSAPPPAVQVWALGCEFSRPLDEGELAELLALVSTPGEG
jgi:hypothetical protein